MIEIRKAGFTNKGAELMLYAILEKIKGEFPQAKFCMTPILDSQPYEKRAQLGLYQKIHFWKKGFHLGELINVLPNGIKERFGIVSSKDVDVVLDAAGFTYSDQWGQKSCEELASSCRLWKKNDTKVILLPQAFGPFKSHYNQRDMKTVTENCDLIFAREQDSYDYLLEISGEQENIKLAPDFTNLMEGVLPENFNTKENRFCIVPNYRMIDKTSKEQSDAYLPFLIICAKYLLEKNQKPFILVHEGEKDMKLAKKINDATGGNLNIIQELHPLKIKGILGACEGTIGSRFHGLVSALSQGVPSLATGWSHKYQMLFKDYGFEDGLLDVTANEKEIYKKIDLVIEEKSRSHIENSIGKNGIRLKKESEKMWNQVFSIISSKMDSKE